MRLFLRVVRLLTLLPMPGPVRIVEGLALVMALVALRVSMDDPDAAGVLVFAVLASLVALACAMRAAALAARADQHDLLRLVVGSGPLLTGLALTTLTRPLLLLLVPVAGLTAWGAGEQRLSLPVFLSLMACVSGLVGGLALGGRASDPDSAARWALPWHLLPYGLLGSAPALAPLSAWQGWSGMDVLPVAALLMLLHVGAALLLPTHRQPPRLPLGNLNNLGCLAACAVAALLLLTVLVPGNISARRQGQFTACKSNLKNLGVAMGMYATEHGEYPGSLRQLTPGILRTIPTCPAAGRETYLVTATTGFTLVCAGQNHSNVKAPRNYPQYTSGEGLREK